jgi:hypothetical protein
MVNPRPSRQRSRIANGSALLQNTDGRSIWARRFRDVYEAHIADLGGEGEISEAEKSIARRVATMAVECERLEALFATAGAATADEPDLYGRTANSLRRLLESTSEFLADHARQQASYAPLPPPPPPFTAPLDLLPPPPKVHL